MAAGWRNKQHAAAGPNCSCRSCELPPDACSATTCTLTDLSSTNFGFLIAYLLPGFTAVWGAAGISPTLRSWLAAPADTAPTIGGFLYATLASIAAGLTISTLRWLLVDTFHHTTGLRRPPWDFSKLQANLGAYDRLEQNHYRYYQFYGNMLIALPLAYFLRRHTLDPSMVLWLNLAVFGLVLLFALGSRDTLSKYYKRSQQLLQVQSVDEPHLPKPHDKPARFKKSTKSTS